MSKIYVGNLSYSTTEKDLEDHFSPFGEVSSVTIINDRETGRSKGFGFVEIESEDATKVIEALNGQELGGRALRVSEAREQQRGGGGGRRSSGGGNKRW